MLNKSTLSLHHLHYLEPTMSPASITAHHSLSPLYTLVIQLHIPCCFIQPLKLLPKGFPKESRKCNLSHPSISLAFGMYASVGTSVSTLYYFLVLSPLTDSISVSHPNCLSPFRISIELSYVYIYVNTTATVLFNLHDKKPVITAPILKGAFHIFNTNSVFLKKNPAI